MAGSILTKRDAKTKDTMAKSPKTYKTRIGTPTTDVDRLLLRGKDTLNDLVGKVSFTECTFLAVTGRMPSLQQTRILDACLVILMDHGITPSALVSRLVADTVPDDIQVPIAAGLLTIGNKYMGTIAGAGALLSRGVASGTAPESWAADTVADYLKRKQRFPGFGHPAYSGHDPRTARLFAVAKEVGLSGRYIALARLVEAEIEKQGGKRLPLNATGAIGALLCEIGFPVVAMRGVAVVSRTAGLLAHAIEELETGSAAEAWAVVQKAIPYSDEN
jgi:citrate synthase